MSSLLFSTYLINTIHVTECKKPSTQDPPQGNICIANKDSGEKCYNRRHYKCTLWVTYW